MTTTGQLTAIPPVSQFANMAATKRIGATKSGSAIWQMTCTCGFTMTADAVQIKKGTARCKECNPRYGAKMAERVLAVLPATYAKIERKTKLTPGQVEYRIVLLREKGLCHIGGWERSEYQGAFNPIFHAGPGKDVPCKLKPRTNADVERRYNRRIKRAIAAAEATGKEDPRYAKHISLHMASKTVQASRLKPQNPFSALFMGGAHA